MNAMIVMDICSWRIVRQVQQISISTVVLKINLTKSISSFFARQFLCRHIHESCPIAESNYNTLHRSSECVYSQHDRWRYCDLASPLHETVDHARLDGFRCHTDIIDQLAFSHYTPHLADRLRDKEW
jgi:hypothetical protein